MVKVSIEVRSGVSRFDVAVQAESIQRAVSFVKERYSKDSVKVKFPIEAESFIVEDPAAPRGIDGLASPTTMPSHTPDRSAPARCLRLRYH